jgi:DME family drug/metabolite transporter
MSLSSRSSLSRSSCDVPYGLAPGLAARTGLVQVTLAALLWGTTGVAVQLVRDTSSLGASGIGFYRLAIAALVLLVWSHRRLGLLLAALRSTPGRLVLVGVGLGAYQGAYFFAVISAGVSVATVVSLGLAPVLIAIWEAIQARRAPSRRTVGTLAAGVLGLVLITSSATEASPAAPRPVLGLLAAVGSGFGYAATTVLSQHLARRVGPQELTTVSTAIGALALAPLAVASNAGMPHQLAALGLLGYLGVVTTALAYALFYAGLRTTAGSSAAVLTLLEPFTAAALAVAVLSEPLSAPAAGGGMLLLGAVAALYLAPARAQRRSVDREPPHSARAKSRRGRPHLPPERAGRA